MGLDLDLDEGGFLGAVRRIGLSAPAADARIRRRVVLFGALIEPGPLGAAVAGRAALLAAQRSSSARTSAASARARSRSHCDRQSRGARSGTDTGHDRTTPLPSTSVVPEHADAQQAHRVIAALIAQRRKVFMNPQKRQPILACLLLVGLQLALELLHQRPVGKPPNDVRRYHAGFSYQAATWDKPRRVVAKVEWHPGELYPRVGFIVTNLSRPTERVVAFYNQRFRQQTVKVRLGRYWAAES